MNTAAPARIPVWVVLPPRTLLLDLAGPIEVLRRALAGLSEEDRELFLRRYYYNQTAEQIAQEKHMNANTVRSRLARGRQALKAELQKGAIQIEDLCAEPV